MLVSNLTGMPRATVTRKLIVDSKKLYHVEKKNLNSTSFKNHHKKIIERLSIFIVKILNLTLDFR